MKDIREHFDSTTLNQHEWSQRASCLFATVCLALFLCLSQTARAEDQVATEASELESLVRQASRIETFHDPTNDELRAAERLFTRTIRGDESFNDLRKDWGELSFDMEILQTPKGRLWLLRESPSHEEGRGCYAFRSSASMPVVLQAPHSFADRHTRRLTAQLFLESRFSAATWNTVHRKITDVAHTDACFLNAFTRAFLKVYGDDALVCQLHGFAREKRTTRAGRTSDIIVSNGTRSGAWWLSRSVTAFRELPDIAVRLFPVEVSELGATTNRQGRLVRDYGLGKFLHLEMSAELRSAFISQSVRRSELLKALEQGFRTHSQGYAESRDY